MSGKNKLLIWEPFEKNPEEIFFDSLVAGQEGFTINFRLPSDNHILRFEFGYTVVFYQSQTDAVSLKSLDEYGDDIFLSPFLIVEDSELIDSIVESSYGIIESTESINLIFRHADGIINTVSSCLPKASLVIDDDE